jgi:hypothetical protein
MKPQPVSEPGFRKSKIFSGNLISLSSLLSIRKQQLFQLDKTMLLIVCAVRAFGFKTLFF